MGELVESVLEYSRADHGVELEVVPLRAALDAALANLQQGITDSGARITIGELPTVRANHLHLVRVFQNLIGNALKFRAQRPLEIRIDAQDDRDGWRVRVSDNGIGIDPAFQGKLFRVFQRLHSSDQYAGSGIGLASCKKIIEHHGGRIWVESAADAGASFIFTLPHTR